MRRSPHLLHENRAIAQVFAVAAVIAVASPAAAECDSAARLGTCIDADTLWPHPGPGRFQSVGATETTAPGEFSLGFVTTYLRKPIVLRAASANPDGTDVPVLDHMVTSNFLWGLGLTDRLELTLAMPVTVYQTGTGVSSFTSSQSLDVPGSALRDFRLGAAYALVPRNRAYPGNAFALTGRLEVGLPTGDEEWFGGDRGAVLVPTLSADYRSGPLFFGAELGARVRKTTNLAGARVGTQGFVALGAGYDILPDEMFSAALEAYALPGFVGQEVLSRDPGNGEIIAEKSSDSLVPAEWMATVRSAPTGDGDVSFSLTGGSALPLTDTAITAPQYRFTAGVRFAPLHRDSDGDGVLDSVDRCPDALEDRDGFQDEDGCPDPDNDVDRIPDSVDQCRDQAEDFDKFQDEDGCPDVDNDGDGVPDSSDQCPNAAEDTDGYQDDDGCPDEDNDGDGVPDAKDACPNAAEDMDGYNDQDGCPDPDNDGDVIPDEKDACPLSPEDKDGFQDEDGCPDLDNDGDGVPDAKDKCPLQPETIDGKDDQDGCPEPGATDQTVLQGSTVTVVNPQRFLPGTSRVSPVMQTQLIMMAQRALGVQPLQMIVVQAYADAPGVTDRNETLAADRADAIRQVLIDAGLPADKLTVAVGDLATKRPPRAPQLDMTVQRGKHD